MFRYHASNLRQDLSLYSGKDDIFDKLYTDKWTELHAIPDVFRYQLEIQDEKILPGKYGILLQLNPDRSSKRRAPDEINSIKQEFNPDKFNFTKISQSECMFEIQQMAANEQFYTPNQHEVLSLLFKPPRDLLIVNSSPICYGHSLLCPDLEDCLPQVVTLKSLILATHIMFLSYNRDLRIGFNSLCAMASVNHLHYHLLVVNRRLPVETVKCHQLKGPVYILEDDYPAQGFCFQIKTKDEIDDVCLYLYKLTSYLMDNNIAHNLYMMYGDSLDGSAKVVLRIFVWARKSSVGIKDLSGISLAVCEFSGHFPVRSYQEYNSLTSKFIINILEETTRPVFDNIRNRVMDLYN